MKTGKYISITLISLCLMGLIVVFLFPDASIKIDEDVQMQRQPRGGLEMNAPEQFAAFHEAIRTQSGASSPAYPPNYSIQELQKAWSKNGMGVVGKGGFGGNGQTSHARLAWVERGPSNVAGRARAVLVDPEDPEHRTWFVGSASGGVWKTTSAGEMWTELTRHLPNLSTTTLAMPASDPDVIYAGTGEGFGAFSFVYGQGIWKSGDKGASWEQLPGTTTDPAFTNVLRLIVDPEDKNILVAATSTGLRRATEETSFIMRSTNGGATWTQVYSATDRIEQVLMQPDNFLIQYATVNSKGLLKSTDGGVTWVEIFDPFFEVGRLEMAVAPSDPSRLYVSAQGGFFNATLFLSSDAGESWEVIDDGLLEEADWLGDLGWYSNAITVDPEDADRVFAAGLDIYKFDVGDLSFAQGRVDEVIETDPEGFFKLDLAGNAPDIAGRLGRISGVNSSTFKEVEVRWGPGKTQKAHRFVEKWVGVYVDYVDVPFQVWDVKNNRQLMTAYEDEDRDNQWDLSGALLEASERIFILDQPYNAAEPHIPTTLNAFNSAQYVLTVTNEGDDPPSGNVYPDASIRIIPEIRLYRSATVQQITDGNGDDPVLSKGVHVDHHQLLFVPANEAGKPPMLLDANDGGIAVSYNMGLSFTQTGDTFSQIHNGIGSSSRPLRGLNTAQFYGVDKMNGADRYVGGIQDNGSWVSPLLVTNTEPWVFAPSNDGFEAAWHYTNPDWIIQSSQFNKMYRSLDGGASWKDISPPGASVFLTRIAKSNKDPDLILGATPSGVVRSEDFGSTWTSINLLQRWPSNASPAVTISLASSDVVWAGAELGGATSLYVSVDRGVTFAPIQSTGIPDMGKVTNIATHPSEPHTAYALFSFADAPKILKTTNLGQTWEDLSGFDNGTESTSGFPDVAVYSLLVMPYDEQILWAGTEIGIFESTNGGQNWQFLDSSFPAVAVWQMRVVNDQVVVATHGRGIWTVQIPELALYEPAGTTLSPVISSIHGGADGVVALDIDLRAAYDSTLVFADNQRVVMMPANNTREVTQIKLNLSAGTLQTTQLSARGYVNGQVFPSTGKPWTLFALNPVQTSYVTNFSSAGNAFVLDGFVIAQQAGFPDAALHSTHPYPDFQDATAVLRTPIRVDEAFTVLSFDEIAQVEAGKTDAPFGSEDFYDYVILEGSADGGLTWQPLKVGYDVRRSGRWNAGASLTTPPTSAQFVNHNINLATTFSAGDEVLIRFRLKSDNAVAGWGWVVDNLQIQTMLPTSVTTENALPLDFALLPAFPNPFQREATLTYTLPEPARVSLSIFDVNGRLVQRLVVDELQSAGTYTTTWNGQTQWGSPAASGVYFYHLNAGDFRETRQLVKVR